jgi:antirestriction protein ArdC
MTDSKQSLYEEVTNSIIEQLEQGAIPWVKPWTADSSADKNIVSQKPYQGINRLILGMTGMVKRYDVPVWASFKQWQSLGANVRKGEKGTRIVFYSPVSKENKQTGETESYAVLKAYSVFNACQVEGLTITTEKPAEKPFTANQLAEERIVKTGAALSHGSDAAFYMPSQDRIQMPHKSAFNTEANYYATAFHELTHWTGHKDRLDRNLEKGRYGNPAYAFEELVAEMGAAFLCQDYGIQGELRHAGYIQSWLKALRDDSKAVFKAAAYAQKAADFINMLDATVEAKAA